ncbi:GntR family transcriptional regulator [Marimonas arenosa]|uniref:GntR family transcriptional regulator n=1 Tax=Marimonas arenosa TaxID=1795305 RepID=A0AAE4B7D1_9RHOB|nr:GntR family transcriptional regulator [Marimonas arenosa]MDQ2092224.1 GntR family transcriptional regulator [Marimonas arenosa]
MGAQADQVRHDILSRVLSRDLMPGDRIDEADLRDRLHLSGTPVREALISLEATGVIERRPRGGARIMSLDLEGLMKMIEVQAETEGAVAFRAARRITPDQATRLQAATRACLDFAPSPRPGNDDYFDLNLAFHRALIDAAGNEFLEQAVFQTANRLVGYLAARHALPGEPGRSAQDHDAICRAVLDHDGDTARILMIAHVSFSDAMALDVINHVHARQT